MTGPSQMQPPQEWPSSVGRILVVGAGGFGREVLLWARDAWADQASKIAGFLSADASLSVPLPILGDPSGYAPGPDDGFVLAIGIPQVRRRVVSQIESRGGRFLTLIHPTAVISPTASVGEGSVICPYAIVSDAVRLGRFTLMNYHSSLGHDASTGDFAVLSPYATLGGGAVIEEDVFLGMHASVGPGKRVGQRTKVSANSAALCDAPPDSLIHGVPGRVGPRVS
jgi:sugar O-acyltransferase (sialic acid O-acetyltransferase NeuD family)